MGWENEPQSKHFGWVTKMTYYRCLGWGRALPVVEMHSDTSLGDNFSRREEAEF